MRTRMAELKAEGLKTINLYNCWLGRRLAPLGTRAHWMFQYTGQDDPTRTTAEKWDGTRYAAALKNITEAQFENFSEGLKPFRPKDNPAPPVSDFTSFYGICLHLAIWS